MGGGAFAVEPLWHSGSQQRASASDISSEVGIVGGVNDGNVAGGPVVLVTCWVGLRAVARGAVLAAGGTMGRGVLLLFFAIEHRAC